MTSKCLENCRALCEDQSKVNGDKLVMDVTFRRKRVYTYAMKEAGGY